ncbi:MAG: zf-TFIIB domain-containing protein [Candidatus Omnitrophota bacterium]|jgi:Zn-finger nucleic acid-binding protein|nr:zf-TFIIB domain-containing protein [Phycisphaerae bacterium]
MICPVCKTVALQNEDLLQNLVAKSCKQCHGRWIPSYQYWQWLDKHGDILPEKPKEEAISLPVEDTGAGKLCPECGHFLTHRKVGHSMDFSLDRCSNCGGIWFDRNEWEVLLSRNLHDEVHFVFSSPWQKQVREEENTQIYESRIEKILGPEDYGKLKDMATWIKSHPNKSTIVSYILDSKV